MFIILFVVVILQVQTYVKIYQIAHYKYMQFIVYQLYFNNAHRTKP